MRGRPKEDKEACRVMDVLIILMVLNVSQVCTYGESYQIYTVNMHNLLGLNYM